jgi:hypothetical protein
MGRKISEGRKTAYYVGMGLAIVGGLLFASTFVSFIARFVDFSNFAGRARSEAAMGFGGMALLVVGVIVMNIGARGAAGSGLILDPDKAREDLEPFTRMGGGMLKDALDEADIHLGGGGPRTPDKVVMIKCCACGKLNEEGSKFCQECGKPL